VRAARPRKAACPQRREPQAEAGSAGREPAAVRAAREPNGIEPSRYPATMIAAAVIARYGLMPYPATQPSTTPQSRLSKKAST
jgi:hypothetical protein